MRGARSCVWGVAVPSCGTDTGQRIKGKRLIFRTDVPATCHCRARGRRSDKNKFCGPEQFVSPCSRSYLSALACGRTSHASPGEGVSPILRLILAAGKCPFNEQRIIQGHLEINVSGSTLLLVPRCFVCCLGRCWRVCKSEIIRKKCVGAPGEKLPLAVSTSLTLTFCIKGWGWSKVIAYMV